MSIVSELRDALHRPLYLSEAETAAYLGRSEKWFRDNAAKLEVQFGFPTIDPALKKRHRPSIEAWAEDRNNRRKPHIGHNSKPKGENWDAF